MAKANRHNDRKKFNRNWKEEPVIQVKPKEPQFDHKDPCVVCDSRNHCKHCNHRKEY